MWELLQSIDDLSFLRRGDFVKISIEPHSQKHFCDPNYEYYFPSYFGKVISSNNKEMDQLLLKGKDGKTFYCINRAGTSGFITGYYYRPKEENLSFEDLEKMEVVSW